ncbi:MAG: co-chaperone GroES family protein [Bacteroidales bacterium]|nr:co-chaperone GroES family protein [Bacteroidales bacterium]
MKSSLDRINVVGDRVLIEPAVGEERTKGGLILPATYQEKADLATGYILKCGPGYALPGADEDEQWNPKKAEPRYLPLQVRPGDMAVFLRKNAVEVKYEGEKYFVVPQNAILLVERFDENE